MEISQIKKLYSEASEAWQDNRDEYCIDMNMVAGNQWDEDSLRDREGRPCLVINKMAGALKQVVGDQRQNRPSIKVQPVDSESDPKTAEVLTGLIRNIEQQSDAESAYDNAFECSSAGGFGFFRINTAYTQEDAFEQDIIIERILDPLSVTFDPYAKKADKSDARYCFIEEVITKVEFEERFPKHKPEDWESQYRDDGSQWFTGENVRIAEFWEKEEYEKLIYQLATGQVIDAESYKEFIIEVEGQKALMQMQGQPIPIVAERKTMCDRVKWSLVCGHKVIETKEWAGKYIPIVGVWGNEYWVDGKIIYKSAVRDARDPQKVYNWMRSTEVETVANAPRQPFLLTPDEIEGHEQQWHEMHRKPQPYLLHNPSQLGRPSRQQSSLPDIGSQNQAMIAADDIKATTGIYDASLGARSNETSGRAILARQREGDVSTFVFIDNLSRALRYAGRILVDLIPKIYDTQRVVRVLGEDGSEDFAEINTPMPDGRMLHDLTTGKYDVTVNVGPSYTTQRVEAADAMLSFAQGNPQFAQLFMDLIAENLDWPGADKIAERAKKMLPQGLAEQDEEDKTPEQLQQEQAQAQQAQMMQQMQMQQFQLQMEKMALENQKMQADIQKMMAEMQIKGVQVESEINTENVQREGYDLDNTLKEIEIQQNMGILPRGEQ